MLKKLLSQLFIKLEGERDNDKKTKNGNSIYFVEKILEEKYGKPNLISSKTIKGYYEKYVENKENNSGEPNSELKNIIARYLGYENLLDFENRNKSFTNNFYEIKKNPKLLFENIFGISAPQSKNIIYIILIILTLTGIYYGNSFKSKGCIIWKNTHYEKINCDNEFSISIPRNLNIETFKKININSINQFFMNGKPLIWYGKSTDGKIEYFNSRGVHPITGNELKPITAYIIHKYVPKNKD